MTNDNNQDFAPGLPPETQQMFDQVRESISGSASPDSGPKAPGSASQQEMPRESPGTMPAPATNGPGAPAQARGKTPRVQVGLLVWGLILALVGLLMIASAVSFAGSLQGVLVGGLIVVGIVFLVLAFTTSNNQQPQQ